MLRWQVHVYAKPEILKYAKFVWEASHQIESLKFKIFMAGF